MIHFQAWLKCVISGYVDMWIRVAAFYGFYILKIINRNKGNFPKCHANISILTLRV